MKLVACLLLITASLGAQDLALYQKKKYIKDGDTLAYRILFPENYNKQKKYPLILFLHGAGERGSDNERQLTHGGKLFLDPQVRKDFPAIIIMPQCPANAYWSAVTIDRTKTPLDLQFNYAEGPTTPLKLAIELVRHITKEEAVDKKRVYISGLSMGGMGTFESVYRYPKLFAAAMPICGGGDPNAYSRKQAKVPFWIFHGSADNVVGVDESKTMVERLKQLNAEVKYTEYEGVGHNSWDNAFAEPQYLTWMFSKSK